MKSRKHEWYEACFVPSASDEPSLRRVINTFVERQGALLAGGVVVRKYLELEAAGPQLVPDGQSVARFAYDERSNVPASRALSRLTLHNLRSAK